MKRCNDCRKILFWKKDRKFGSYKITTIDKNGKYREHVVFYCAKCGEKITILQTKIMAQALGKKPSDFSIKTLRKNLRS